MDSIASALTSIPAIAWGEIAMGHIGVGLVFNYMLVIEDADFDIANESLRRAGFRDAPWSYGSTKDPQFFQDKRMQDIHQSMGIEYHNVDKNSTRFVFPLGSEVKERAVLLRSSYVHLGLNSIPESRFTRIEKIYYPDQELLLESFVKTLVREPGLNMWTEKLEMWAISYVYGQLMINDNALDSSFDEQAKIWFNDNIPRYSGGIDRTTVTKRVGRKC